LVGEQCGVESCVVETERVRDGRNVWEMYAAVVQTSKNQSEGKERAERQTVRQVESSVG